MGFKDFGIITKEKYTSLNKRDKERFLYDNHLVKKYSAPVVVSFNKTNEKAGLEGKGRISLDNIIYKFSDSLVNNVYLFLKEYLKGAIRVNMIMFYRDFDNDTYGFSKKKKKKEALKYFNELFYQVVSKDEVGLETNFNNEEGAEKRVKSLKRKQNEFLFLLKKENDLIENYIVGNKEYYSRELLDTHPLLLDIFVFENILAILIDLNNKFQFEIDDIFTPKTKAQLIYEAYPYEFKSLEQLQFIEKQIVGAVKVDRALIVSLFYLFKNKLSIQIPSAVLFQSIINKFFNLDIGALKLSDPQNSAHEKRLIKLAEKWKSKGE